MSGRGRGGRGGGRGGVSRGLNREQLSSLGVTSNENLPGPVTQPPPTFPFIGKHPAPILPCLEHDYLLILKQDFLDQLHLSPSYIRMPESKTNQLEQEIDKLVAQLPQIKEQYDWNLFPSELRPKMLAKRTKKIVPKDINITEKLIKLEKIEEKTNNDTVKVKIEVDDENEDDKEMELADEEQEDEEMDDGTDYANNYFDNGEEYEDDDDNLDDGPIY